MKRCYYLQRNIGKNLLLHPLTQNKEVISWEDEQIETLVGSDADTSVREQVTYELYGVIDSAVDLWIQELKYIPRLINSALAFLVIYFFLSFVIRDPLPLVDELIGASIAAVAVYLITASKSKRSTLAMKRRSELKGLVDQMGIREDPTLEVYERLLDDFDQLPPLTLADQITENDEQLPSVSLPASSPVIHQYLGDYLRSFDPLWKAVSGLDELHGQASRESYSALLLSQSRDRAIDLSLIALYRITG